MKEREDSAENIFRPIMDRNSWETVVLVTYSIAHADFFVVI